MIRSHIERLLADCGLTPEEVSGVWPHESRSIKEIAEQARISTTELTLPPWIWKFTHYDADSSAQPEQDERYVLSFQENGKFEVSANCGKWKERYTFGGKTLAIEMGKNWISRCKKDVALKIFLDS
jgi:hypothetical protein